MAIESIAVIGSGTMGSGIAESAAVAGLRVAVVDVAETPLERSRSIIQTSLDKAVRRGKIVANERDRALERLTFSTDRTVISNCQVVVEAIIEDLAAKSTLHAEIGAFLADDVIQATNTSSISITKLAESSGRPSRFIGMHFFNPVPVMPLVEVILAPATSDETIAVTEALARRMNKTPLRVRDAPGFVSNRVLMPLINEAVFALAEDIADAATIDQVMVLGCNHPMGPLALADLIGLDVCLSIMEVLERDTGNAKFRPCELLRQRVREGRLGRKSGRGFFDYLK